MFTLSPFVGTLLGNIVVALGIIIVVSLAKVLKQRYEKYLEYITAMTVGLLLGIIFLGFLPEITSESGLAGESIGLYFLF
ncbi:MAG: hypothetical protein H6767_00690 [Candidatus Peribacteria bacterium]|nr:MAG: hypothetical protein H6767_00690 [Candidatus Peribacteria bacterium]